MSTGEYTDTEEIPTVDQGWSSHPSNVVTEQLISLDNTVINSNTESSNRVTSGSSCSVEVLSRQVSSEKSSLQQRLDKELEEKKLLEGKLKAYQTLGKKNSSFNGM